MAMMDSRLQDAALNGHVKFLEEALAVQPPEYFLARNYDGRSIFHIASLGNQIVDLEFMKAAMNILPQHILKQLLQATDNELYTPLHLAAFRCRISFIKCVREMYESLSWDDEDHVKPWLALNQKNQTPLNCSVAAYGTDEECAMEIMLIHLYYYDSFFVHYFESNRQYLNLRLNVNLWMSL